MPIILKFEINYKRTQINIYNNQWLNFFLCEPGLTSIGRLIPIGTIGQDLFRQSDKIYWIFQYTLRYSERWASAQMRLKRM